MGARDHRQSRKPYHGVRPLSSLTQITVNRVRSTNGIVDMTIPVANTLNRSFQQSAYIRGNHRDPNSHSYRKRDYPCLVGTYSKQWTPGPFQTQSGSMRGLVDFGYDMYKVDPRDLSVSDIARRRASSKFFKQLRDADSNLAVDIAESSKTRKMMTKTVKDVIRIARSCRRDALRWARENYLARTGHISERRRHRDAVPAKYRRIEDPSEIMANRWLEYQYGWRPLLSTIFEVSTFQRNKAKSFRLQANAKHRRIRKNIKFVTTGNMTVWNDMEDSSYATIRCDYLVSSPLVNDVSRLSSMNPAPILWELVPYSFVVDWVFDIGRYLQELETSFMSGLTFKRGYSVYTHRFLNKVLWPSQSSYDGSGYVFKYGDTSIKQYDIEKVRVRLDASPLPFFPRIEARLGAQRLLSAAALLRQIFTFR